MHAGYNVRTYILKALAVFLTVLFAAGFMCGCSKYLENYRQENNEMDLNERQKDILEMEGLPTSAEELTALQREHIAAIEEMLEYLENKYGEAFRYYGYVPEQGADKEHLKAFPEAMSSNDIVTVTREYKNGKFVCTDDYEDVMALPVYQSSIDKYFESVSIDAKAFISSVRINKTAGGTADKSASGNGDKNTDRGLNKNNVVAYSSAKGFVVLNSSKYGQEDFEKIVKDFGKWLKNEAEPPSADTFSFILVKPEDYEKINEYNYSDMIYAVDCIQYRNCTLTSEGRLHIE